MIRARAEQFTAGEMPTKRALADEKRYAKRNEISRIEFNGVVTEQLHEIQLAFSQHYQDLFSYKKPQSGFDRLFLTQLPQLESDVTKRLEVPISMGEIEEAIENLNNGKSPGPDGLGADFYKAFKSDLAVFLCDVFRESFSQGCLPPSFSQAHTILIPKSDDPDQLSKVTGFRPITLTNTDYKIFMNILARRLQGVIKTLVGPHQTCGIKGRSIYTNIHVVRSILELCDMDFRRVAMLQIDFEKAFDKVSHDILFQILRHVGIGNVIFEGVRMAYLNSTTKIIVNKKLTESIQVCSSVRQGCALSSLLFALYVEPLCAKINKSDVIRGFVLESSDVKVLAYADDVAIFCIDRESVRNALSITQEYCEVTGSSVNFKKCVGLWHGDWTLSPSVYERVTWSTKPTCYLGIPFEHYRENTKYWYERAHEMRAQTERWGGRNLSIFARATVCNMFLVSKLWYIMQALYCSRLNVQKFHRIFAVFVWQSQFERTCRSNLFRRLEGGGIALPHLFIRQLVSRFSFLRDQSHPFVRTFLQIKLANALPDFVVSTVQGTRMNVSNFLREVVSAYRFLSARFSREYLSSVTRKKLSRDLTETLFAEPLYRTLFRTGPGQDVLKRVKKMPISGGVKTFFYKLHTETLPVKTWMQKRNLFLPWGADCFLCKKPESVEHVFLDCWDAVFFWDVLQRTFKKDLPLTSHGIRYLSIAPETVPYDMFFLLGLHGIWRNRMAVRNADVDARSVCSYFVENVCKMREVFIQLGCDDELLSVMNELVVMKVHK